MKNFKKALMLGLTALAASFVSATEINFDDLTAGTQIDMASAYFSVQKVDGTTMIAEVSSTMAKSGANSLYLLDNSTADKPFVLADFAAGPAEAGTISFDAFIPSSNEKIVYINVGVGKNNSDRYFEMRISGSGKVEYEAGSDDPDVAKIPTGVWHNITFNWADGKFSFIIDGAPVEAATNVSVSSTGLNVNNVPTTLTIYSGDKRSTGTEVYIDNITSDLF